MSKGDMQANSLVAEAEKAQASTVVKGEMVAPVEVCPAVREVVVTPPDPHLAECQSVPKGEAEEEPGKEAVRQVKKRAEPDSGQPKAGDVGKSEEGADTRGRWSPEEHERFLVGLHKYGNLWAKVTEHVGTRTPRQTRSHAQKYFRKLRMKELQKIRQDPERANYIFVITREYLNRTPAPEHIIELPDTTSTHRPKLSSPIQPPSDISVPAQISVPVSVPMPEPAPAPALEPVLMPIPVSAPTSCFSPPQAPVSLLSPSYVPNPEPIGMNSPSISLSPSFLPPPPQLQSPSLFQGSTQGRYQMQSPTPYPMPPRYVYYHDYAPLSYSYYEPTFWQLPMVSVLPPLTATSLASAFGSTSTTPSPKLPSQP